MREKGTPKCSSSYTTRGADRHILGQQRVDLLLEQQRIVRVKQPGNGGFADLCHSGFSLVPVLRTHVTTKYVRRV